MVHAIANLTYDGDDGGNKKTLLKDFERPKDLIAGKGEKDV